MASRMTVARLSTAALAGVCVFAIACGLLQLVRTDLDWQQTPMSLYLYGDYGPWLRTAYWTLGIGLVLLGAGFYRGLPVQARSAAPWLLFAFGGLALGVTASADSNLPGGPQSFEGFIHGIAANTAFLCTTTAMLLQSWWFRADGRWRRYFTPAFALAMLSFVAMWGHALWRTAPRGLTQKIVIALILLWLGLAATWLRRDANAPRFDNATSH